MLMTLYAVYEVYVMKDAVQRENMPKKKNSHILLQTWYLMSWIGKIYLIPGCNNPVRSKIWPAREW